MSNRTPDYEIVVPVIELEKANVSGDDDYLKEVVAGFCPDPSFSWDNIDNIHVDHKPMEAICIFQCFKKG
jgi:hypothetical protein